MDKVFVFICLLYFWACSVYSVLAPFYPTEAEQRGMSQEMTGFLFSMFALIAFVFSPITGKLMLRVGRKKVMLVGSIIECVGVFIFAWVVYFEGTAFVVVSFIGRFLMGVGGSALLTSCFAVLSNIYSDEVETKIGIMETCGGVGLIVGPLIGAFLYFVGGYTFVFLSYAVLFLWLSFTTYSYLPEATGSDQDKDNQLSLSKLAFHPKITVDLGIVVLGMAGPAFLEPILASHLNDHLSMKSEVIAVLFALPTIGYTAAVRIQSMIPKSIDRVFILLLGLTIEGVSFVLVGPWGGLGIRDNPYVIVTGLVLLGFGSALAYLPSLPHMIETASRDMEIQNKDVLTDCLSSIMGTCHYLGEFLAPFSAGFLTAKLGFEDSTAVFGVVVLLYSVAYALGVGALGRLYKCQLHKEEEVELERLSDDEHLESDFQKPMNYQHFEDEKSVN
mmetsp:Transcript_12954/g.18903  ORF Transcript_12954/g.18903 Transcript_12954/m.18903 type:complete len:445 (-) Transcript_12954:47-1381(-)